LIAALASFGLVNTATEVDTSGELGTNLDLRGGLHYANKYGDKLKKVKLCSPVLPTS